MDLLDLSYKELLVDKKAILTDPRYVMSPEQLTDIFQQYVIFSQKDMQELTSIAGDTSSAREKINAIKSRNDIAKRIIDVGVEMGLIPRGKTRKEVEIKGSVSIENKIQNLTEKELDDIIKEL